MKAIKQENQRMKDPPLDNSPPGAKKKGKQKHEIEPMVILPTIPPESIAQYSINLPSGNKDRMLDEMDMLRNITEHLNEIVHKMEHVYVKEDETEKEEGGEEEASPKEDHEDMTSFLICCSQLSNQLETALREEKLILESLLQWFEKEVHEMEEIGEEELIPDWQVPMADKNITNNISKLMNRIQRLEELKGRVQELPKLIQMSMPKQQEKKRPVSPVPPVQKDPKNIIEELAMKHATEDVMNMVQVFQEDTGPQTIDTLNNRMLEIMKVFERQTNKLHRVTNEQDVLEGKLQKIQQEFRKLAEEKEIMEDELQKMRLSEVPQEKVIQDARKKILPKLEKLPHVPSEKGQKGTSVSPKHKENENLKMKEDLAKAQANVQSLEKEKKMLEEMLQKALEEAGKAKVQLAEIPPNIPDWNLPSTVQEGDKDLSKKGKKATKSKGKGEITRQISGTESERRLQRPDIGKAIETSSGKSQDISTAPQTKDVKHKKKGTAHPDLEARLSEATSVHEKEPAGVTEESKKKARIEGKLEADDSKSAAKAKDSIEMKKRRSTTKGAGKETDATTVSEFSPLSSIQEKQPSTDSTKVMEEILPGTLGTSPEEMLSIDSEGRKTKITISPQKEESLPIKGQKVSPLLSEIKDSLTLTSAEPEKITREPERRSVFGIFGKESVPQPTKIAEKIPTALTSEGAQPTVTMTKERMPVPYATEDRSLTLKEAQAIERIPSAVHIDSLGLQDKLEEDQTENKRTLLANIASALQLLQETQDPEVGQSEDEVKAMEEKRRVLLANLESNLKGLQQAQAVGPTQQDANQEIKKLSEKRSQLLASLDLNKKHLEQAQALAASQPSEMNKNKVKELLRQRGLLEANLEANLLDLQNAKALEANLTKKDKKEKEINDLSEKREVLLQSLESNLKDLQEAQALATAQPGSVSDEKIKQLTEQRMLLTANLEKNVQDLQKAFTPSLAEESQVTGRELYELAEKKQRLIKNLESNQKELQEAQALAATQPGSVSEHKLQELAEKNKRLIADLETTVDTIQEAERCASKRAVKSPERELYELSEKKQLLLKHLESNQKELQEAQALAATHPGSISEHKLQELAKTNKHLTANLEAIVDKIKEAEHHASERAVKSPERELYELAEKKQLLLRNLESNQRELQKAQVLAATQPGSVSEHKLQELAEKYKCLTEDLEATMDKICETEHRASERGVTLQYSERELYELSEKKQLLLKILESNQKELQEAQALAATQPGSVSEHELQKLAEQNRLLTAELEATVHHIHEAERHAAKKPLIVQPPGRELYELSQKKQLLLDSLESNRKELQEAQVLAATQPGSISAHKLQELAEQRRHLNAELEATVHNIQEVQRHASEGTIFIRPSIRDLFQLYEMKQVLLENLESNARQLQEAQALDTIQPGSISEHKLLELTEQRRRLTVDLEATVDKIQKTERRASKSPVILRPAERELYELSEKQQLLLENLDSNWKELQEADALAATEPGSVNEHKRQELAKQRQRLTADLEATVENIQKAQRRDSERAVVVRPVVRELYELTEKKHLLLGSLESNERELQKAQALAAVEPGSISESKLQELAEERKRLTAELEETLNDIQNVQRRVSDSPVIIQPVERELYELSDKKQLLLENLKELQEAQAAAATQAGAVSETKRQELVDQRRNLTIELEQTMHDMQKVQSRPTKVILTPGEKELYELSEKKQFLLEMIESNWKELQAAQALATTQPGSVNERKLQQLIEQRIRLTTDLEATVYEIQKLQRRSSEIALIGYSERELHELSEKKHLLLGNLESNRKELQAAQALAASQPGSISEYKLRELVEERRRLFTDLEATVDNIQKAQRRVSGRALIVQPAETELYDLSVRKRLLLGNLESNLKDLKEAHTLAATLPGSISMAVCQLNEIEVDNKKPKQIKLETHLSPAVCLSVDSFSSSYKGGGNLDEYCGNADKIMQELYEQTKLLSAKLEAVVQDIQEIKASVSETGRMKRPIERDVHQLFQKKKMFLERLEANLKSLHEAQTLAANHPGSINEHYVQQLIEQRRLLVAGLEAVMQDIEDVQGLVPVKAGTVKSKENVLEELSQKRMLFLEHLASNLKHLKQAQVLAAAHPGDIGEDKVKKLTEQRRLLAAGLEAIVRDIREMQGEVSDQEGILKPSEKELDELSEKRRLFWENLELNLKEVKELHALATTQPDNMGEQKMQMLIEKRNFLAAVVEQILEDMKQAQSLDSDQDVMTITDELNINDLIQLSILESKLDELQQIGALSDIQLHHMKRKVHTLRRKKEALIDGWEIPFYELQSLTSAELEEYGLSQKELKEILRGKKGLFSYVRSSIRDLQHKGLLPEDSVIGKGIHKQSEEKNILDEYLVAVPTELLQSESAAISTKYGPEDEQMLKQKALAAKLEANIKDLQAAFKAEQIKIAKFSAEDQDSKKPVRWKPSVTEPLLILSDQQMLKPSVSGLHIQITKVPEIQRDKSGHMSSGHRSAELEMDVSSILSQPDKILKKEIELALKRQLLHQLPSRKPSLPQVTGPASFGENANRAPMDITLQEIIDYNRNMLPGHRANLHQALLLAQDQIQQATNLAAERRREMSVFYGQPSAPGISRFHEYTLQPAKPAWEGYQLPQKGYAHKMNLLRKKLMGPEMKGVWGGPPLPTQGPTSLAATTQDQGKESIVICGKNCNPYRSKREMRTFPVISTQPLRHD